MSVRTYLVELVILLCCRLLAVDVHTVVKQLVLRYVSSYDLYLRRRLASDGIVTLGVTLSRCVCVRRAAAKALHSA